MYRTHRRVAAQHPRRTGRSSTRSPARREPASAAEAGACPSPRAAPPALAGPDPPPCGRRRVRWPQSSSSSRVCESGRAVDLHLGGLCFEQLDGGLRTSTCAVVCQVDPDSQRSLLAGPAVPQSRELPNHHLERVSSICRSVPPARARCVTGPPRVVRGVGPHWAASRREALLDGPHV